MNCPLCGAKVTYVGLGTIECAGAAQPARPADPGIMGWKAPTPAVPAKPACQNFRPCVTTSSADYIGSLAWARAARLTGHKMEFFSPSLQRWVEHDPRFADNEALRWRCVESKS